MEPLAERLRPVNLEDYVGQEHLLSKDSLLRKAIESENLHSMIFWGPPGCGKTTLANIISKTLKSPMYTLSAISSGVSDVRSVFEKVEKSGLYEAGRAILFIDEIHRFSKSQQDILLNAVEKGLITLIGATTENPSFEVISPLLSRCQVYILKPLTTDHLKTIVNLALEKDRWLKSLSVTIKEYDALFELADGDGRKVLNNLEIIIQALLKKEPGPKANPKANPEQNQAIEITNAVVSGFFQDKTLVYDKSGENHYNIISAFIKSIRGSDPNAAVYWLARMIAGGEKPEFIARRMVILASEDIGNANPTAFVVAANCMQMVHSIGWPESRIILSQCAIYLATSVKSNASYKAINEAQKLVKKTGNLPVPLHLRNAPTSLMKDIGYGENYLYAHDYEKNFIPQEFFPEDLSGTIFYEPGNNPKEKQLKEHLKNLWKNRYNYE